MPLNLNLDDVYWEYLCQKTLRREERQTIDFLRRQMGAPLGIHCGSYTATQGRRIEGFTLWKMRKAERGHTRQMSVQWMFSYYFERQEWSNLLEFKVGTKLSGRLYYCIQLPIDDDYKAEAIDHLYEELRDTWMSSWQPLEEGRMDWDKFWENSERIGDEIEHPLMLKDLAMNPRVSGPTGRKP